MSASRWAPLLAGVRAAGSARLRHAVGCSLRRASIHRIGQAASSALRASRLAALPPASARPCPASSSTLPRLLLHRIREAAARLPGASAETVRLLRAELDQVRRGAGLHGLRPASSEALARLRAASAEVMTLFRDELAELSVDAVLEETRLPEETSHIFGPRLRAVGKAVADVVVDRNRLSDVFYKSDYLLRKTREQRRPAPRRPPPVHLVPRPAPPANWRSLLAPSALRRPAVAVRPLPHPSSSFLRPWHMPPALLGPRTN